MSEKKPKFETFDLIYALQNAAEFLENEEWPGFTQEEKEAQEAANREGAKRIRRMIARIESKSKD